MFAGGRWVSQHAMKRNESELTFCIYRANIQNQQQKVSVYDYEVPKNPWRSTSCNSSLSGFILHG